MADWINEIGKMGSTALDYLEDNEWAANALAGAAAGGLAYLNAQEERDFRREESDRAWDRKLHLAEAPNIDAGQYDWSDLTQGGLTDGGLIAQAKR